MYTGRAALTILLSLSLSLLCNAARADSGDLPARNVEQYVDSVLLERISIAATELADLARNRARRAYAVGPFVGGSFGATLAGGADGGVAVGLVFTRFDFRVYRARQELIEVARARFRVLVLGRADAAQAHGEDVDDQDMRRFALQAWEQLHSELLVELKPKRLEKPGRALRVGGSYYLGSEAFDLRLTGLIGLSRVFLETGVVARFDSAAGLVIPAGVSLPVTLGLGKSSPVVDFFARIDVAVTSRSSREDTVLLGATVQFDAI